MFWNKKKLEQPKKPTWQMKIYYKNGYSMTFIHEINDDSNDNLPEKFKEVMAWWDKTSRFRKQTHVFNYKKGYFCMERDNINCIDIKKE